MSEGNKLDSGKLQYHLIPASALAEVARVFTYGASLPAYGPWNWYKGLKYSRLYDATQRHLEAFRSGETHSEHEVAGEPCHHLAHAIFGLLCILQFDLEGRNRLNDLQPPELTEPKPEPGSNKASLPEQRRSGTNQSVSNPEEFSPWTEVDVVLT